MHIPMNQIRRILRSILDKLQSFMEYFDFLSLRRFNHIKAQRYELHHAKHWMQENFEDLYSEINRVEMEKEFWPGRGELDEVGFFDGDEETWLKFASHIDGKRCLEIGPGPCGALAAWWWVKQRIFIDPLIEEYKQISLELFDRTWYTEDLSLYSLPGETFIPDLVGSIDGAIICRNALDHCAVSDLSQGLQRRPDGVLLFSRYFDHQLEAVGGAFIERDNWR